MTPMLEAVLDAEKYLEGYAYGVYPKTFAEYTERFVPRYIKAVQESGDLSRLAEEILDGLAQSVREQRFFNRSRARGDQKLMLAVYVTPMLLAAPEPGCRELAGILRAKWQERYPKDAYRMADYERIAGGFHRKILGFTVEEKPKETEE